MSQRCAVVGIGQTKHDTMRVDVSLNGLVREAVDRAMKDADVGWKDIDAIVVGKAPDMFEGTMMPELYLADAFAASGKPVLRVHTAGSVGGSTGIVGSSLITGGVHQRVLVVTYEKQSEGNAMWALTVRMPFQQAVVAGAGGYFAPLIRAYIARSKAPEDTGIRVALKDRQNGLKNPHSHLQLPDISYEMVAESPMLWDPIRYLETCPSSDGACAVVLASEDAARKSPGPAAWVHATAMRSEPTMFSGRNQVNPQAGRECAAALYKQAGITNPRTQIDVAEVYVPFSWFEPMWMEGLGFAEEDAGWKMTADGVTAFDGELPVNPSGGVLSSNPIGASGMLRFAEAAMQVRGQAGKHQVDGAKTALGHAYGGGSQYYSMWIVSGTRD